MTDTTARLVRTQVRIVIIPNEDESSFSSEVVHATIGDRLWASKVSRQFRTAQGAYNEAMRMVRINLWQPV
jgi:hypothetical protein